MENLFNPQKQCADLDTIPYTMRGYGKVGACWGVIL